MVATGKVCFCSIGSAKNNILGKYSFLSQRGTWQCSEKVCGSFSASAKKNIRVKYSFLSQRRSWGEAERWASVRHHLLKIILVGNILFFGEGEHRSEF